MKPPTTFLSLLALFASGATTLADDDPTPEIALTVHHYDGFSAASSPDPKLILFKAHTHFHLRLSNQSDKAIEIWKPGCPEGDLAFKLEFRAIGSDQVKRAQTQHIYTAGSGNPRTHTLAAGDDLIVNVDLIGRTWSFPLALAKGEVRDIEMRAVFEPSPYRDERHAIHKLIKRPWTGNVASPWEQLTIVNRTGDAFGPWPPAKAKPSDSE